MPLLQLDMNVFLKHYWQILKQFKIKLLLVDKELSKFIFAAYADFLF